MTCEIIRYELHTLFRIEVSTSYFLNTLVLACFGFHSSEQMSCIYLGGSNKWRKYKW